MNKCSKDFINNLPDALISHILSFILIKEAALTSVLSKRWRYLFVPNLVFDDSVNVYERMNQRKRREMRTSFQAFVDRVLALQGDTLVNKFYLRCRYYVEPSSVNRWILNVLERGVVNLDMHVPMNYGYPLPSEVLMSKSLVKLNVEGSFEFSTDVGEVFLPRLKTLVLHRVEFNENGASFAKLISGCPALEELDMIDVLFTSEFVTVSSPTVKRLKLRFDYSLKTPRNVSFDTPNLAYLEFNDNYAEVKYSELNFTSLVEANLNVQMRHYYHQDSVNATDLFIGVCNVEILSLPAPTIEILALHCKAIHNFNNLNHLTIDTREELQWESLPKLLENCPNLETLVFRGLCYQYRTNHDKPWECTRTCLSSSPVKLLKVLDFGNEMEVIKYFLETMPKLEQVMIYYNTLFYDDVSISTEFQMLEKVALSKCKIQILPDNLKSPSYW